MKTYSHYKSRKKSKKKSHARTYFFIFLFLVLAGAAVYFFWFWPGFKIEKIIIAGGTLIPAGDFEGAVRSFLSEKSFNFLPQDKIFTFRTQKLKDSLREKFPEIKDLILKRKPPQEISFEIKEREKRGLWCKKDSGECYFFDDEGIIFHDSPQMISSLFLTIFCGQEQEVSLGKAVIDPADLEKIIKIKELSKQAGSVDFISLNNYHAGAPDFEFVSKLGWRAFFDAQEDLAKQVYVMSQTLEKEIKDKEPQLDYIDLRVKNRAYYKYKDNK